MEKHLLLAVGDDMSSLHGVRFLCSFFEHKASIQVTLCYIASSFDPKDPRSQASSMSSTDKKTFAPPPVGHESIDAGMDLLLSRGFKKDKVNAAYKDKKLGTVKDLVHEGQRGMYDAVVLGRRGYAMFEQAFASSVSRQMLEQNIDFPLWVCRQPEENRQHVLVCMDPSEPSMRIADHVGFMLEKETRHDIKLFYVDEGGAGNTRETLERGRQLLLKNGIDDKRISTQIVRSSNVPDAILSEVERGAYSVVAMGRGGSPQKGLLKKWLIGSRSLKVFEELSKSVLWLSK